jgi:ATP-dependent helicase YprA (DUF1998 family)
MTSGCSGLQHPAIADLARQGIFRDRGGRWHHTGRKAPLVSLRGTGGRPIRVVEQATGRLIGTMDEPSSHSLLHTGAVYSHQGDLFLVTNLDLSDGVALVRPGDPGFVTSAHQLTDIQIAAEHQRSNWGHAVMAFGDVLVTRQVTSFTRRKPETASGSVNLPSIFRPGRCGPERCGGRSRQHSGTRSPKPELTCQAPRTRLSTRPSACCRL